jgi:hypothetical protein
MRYVAEKAWKRKVASGDKISADLKPRLDAPVMQNTKKNFALQKAVGIFKKHAK